MSKHLGQQSIKFETPVSIAAAAATVGPKEGKGPLRKYFDVIWKDTLSGEESWEKAESKLVRDNFELVVSKAGLQLTDIDYILAGDLLNQSVGSTFGIRDLNRPFWGLFGACSTMGESMALGAILIDGQFAVNVLAGASSHFCAAEKQFRFPLELGAQRPLTSSWTVTGDGAVVLSRGGNGPFIRGITTGRIVDMGITDANNMGAAMAPAAADTIISHLRDFGLTPENYDKIITGDLGAVGSKLLIKLALEQACDLSGNHEDCGIEIFDAARQDTHAGGSGCGCSAAVFAAYYYKKLLNRQLKKILFVPTGALMSQTSCQQGESIPGIAHAVAIEACL